MAYSAGSYRGWISWNACPRSRPTVVQLAAVVLTTLFRWRRIARLLTTAAPSSGPSAIHQQGVAAAGGQAFSTCRKCSGDEASSIGLYTSPFVRTFRRQMQLLSESTSCAAPNTCCWRCRSCRKKVSGRELQIWPKWLTWFVSQPSVYSSFRCRRVGLLVANRLRYLMIIRKSDSI